MSFENKQKISEIDLGWKKADYVPSKVDLECDDFDKNPDHIQLAWFKIDAPFMSNEKEEKERIQAMQRQFENKIINKYGFPYGSEMPKEVRMLIKEKEKQDNKKGNKWDRKRKKLIDKQLEKDMKLDRAKENTVMNSLPSSPFSLNELNSITAPGTEPASDTAVPRTNFTDSTVIKLAHIKSLEKKD